MLDDTRELLAATARLFEETHWTRGHYLEYANGDVEGKQLYCAVGGLRKSSGSSPLTPPEGDGPGMGSPREQEPYRQALLALTRAISRNTTRVSLKAKADRVLAGLADRLDGDWWSEWHAVRDLEAVVIEFNDVTSKHDVIALFNTALNMEEAA